MNKTMQVLVSVMAVVALVAAPVQAQKNSSISLKAGQITGTAKTPAGQAMANTKVEFVNAKGKVVAQSRTDAEGAYSVNLPAGEYSVVIDGNKITGVGVSTSSTATTTVLPIIGGLGALSAGTIVAGALVIGATVAAVAVAVDNNNGGGSDPVVSP